MEAGFTENEELYMDEEPVEFFYVWKENWLIFDLFQLLIPFLKGPEKDLDTGLLIALVEEKKTDPSFTSLSDIVRKIPYVLKGYIDELFPTPESTDSK